MDVSLAAPSAVKGHRRVLLSTYPLPLPLHADMISSLRSPRLQLLPVVADDADRDANGKNLQIFMSQIFVLQIGVVVVVVYFFCVLLQVIVAQNVIRAH